MPVARIFTVHPERTDALLKQLESEGYSVEIVRPESTAAPADLEIDFEICPEEHALDRAVELAEHLHADIAVAPGVELSRREAVEQPAAKSVQPVPAAAPNPMAVPAAQAEAPAAQLEASSPGPVRQADNSPAQPVASPPKKEDVSVPPAVWMAAAEPARQQPQAIARDTAAREPERASIQRSSEEPADMFAATAESDSRAQKALRSLAAAWDATRHLGHEYKERLDLRMAEIKAERQRRLLELEKRKAALQERANELQAARDAASARLQELLRERGGEPAAAPAVQSETVSAPTMAAPQNGQPAAPGTGSWRTQPGFWLGRRHAPQIQAILTGVAAMAALFVLGLALASFRPRPALSNSLDHPYQGVTVQSGGVTIKPSASPHAGNTPRPSPAVRSPETTVKQSPARKAAPGKRTSFGDDVTVQQLTRKSSGGGAGAGAGDVTVRKMQQPKPAPKSTPQAEMKHISDLDN